MMVVAWALLLSVRFQVERELTLATIKLLSELSSSMINLLSFMYFASMFLILIYMFKFNIYV